MATLIDAESDPGSYADMIAHSPCLRVETFTGAERTSHHINATTEKGRPNGA